MDIIPLVSVIIPVCNGEKYIEKAILSILRQTYKAIELIVINDGSTDGTQEILEKYKKDITYFTQPNQGPAESFNVGIKMAKGKYFARMDADDISLPDRIDKQVAFLEEHDSIGICGTAATVIDEYGKKIYSQQMPLTDLEIRWKSLFTSPFISSSVLGRMEIVNSYSFLNSSIIYPAEDYALWSSFLKYTKGNNLNEELVCYRIHHNSITSTNLNLLQINQRAVARNNISYCLGLEITEDEIKNLCNITSFENKNYKNANYPLCETLINYLTLWKLFREKYQLSGSLTRIENKILTQTLGILLLYVPLRHKNMVMRKMNEVNKNWMLMVPKMLFPYLTKYITYQKVLKHR